jgi:hypothetical protein
VSKNVARTPFFLYLAIAFLAIALTGFSTTFFVPLALGTFDAPSIVYVHGVLLFGWLLLFLSQSALARSRNLTAHRRSGWAGACLAMAIVVSGIYVGVFAARRDLAATGQDWPFGAFVNIVIEMVVFGSLVAAAVASRRSPESHKRFLVLATISALGPAWFRFRHFMPFVPNPLLTFSLVADSVLLVVLARDWLTLKRVHPVYIWAGGAMVATHIIELAASESQLWLRAGRWLLGPAAA